MCPCIRGLGTNSSSAFTDRQAQVVHAERERAADRCVDHGGSVVHRNRACINLTVSTFVKTQTTVTLAEMSTATPTDVSADKIEATAPCDAPSVVCVARQGSARPRGTNPAQPERGPGRTNWCLLPMSARSVHSRSVHSRALALHCCGRVPRKRVATDAPHCVAAVALRQRQTCHNAGARFLPDGRTRALVIPCCRPSRRLATDGHHPVCLPHFGQARTALLRRAPMSSHDRPGCPLATCTEPHENVRSKVDRRRHTGMSAPTLHLKQ